MVIQIDLINVHSTKKEITKIIELIINQNLPCNQLRYYICKEYIEVVLSNMDLKCLDQAKIKKLN